MMSGRKSRSWGVKCMLVPDDVVDVYLECAHTILATLDDWLAMDPQSVPVDVKTAAMRSSRR